MRKVQRSLSLLRNMQFLQESRLKTLSRVGTTVFELHDSVESVDNIKPQKIVGSVPLMVDITNSGTQCVCFLHSWLGDEHVFTIGEYL